VGPCFACTPAQFAGNAPQRVPPGVGGNRAQIPLLGLACTRPGNFNFIWQAQVPGATTREKPVFGCKALGPECNWLSHGHYHMPLHAPEQLPRRLAAHRIFVTPTKLWHARRRASHVARPRQSSYDPDTLAVAQHTACSTPGTLAVTQHTARSTPGTTRATAQFATIPPPLQTHRPGFDVGFHRLQHRGHHAWRLHVCGGLRLQHSGQLRRGECAGGSLVALQRVRSGKGHGHHDALGEPPAGSTHSRPSANAVSHQQMVLARLC